jgi:cyclic pyranopterin monophosphate synthase
MDRTPATRAERRRLTHVDRTGRPRMVDVSDKPATARRAVAEALVTLAPETLSLVIDGRNAKGDVLGVAELAGVMGGKRTSDLIPLCHPLPLTHVAVEIAVGEQVEIVASAETTAQTGVEMEALVAASVAALTVYDMAKAIDSSMEVAEVRLLEKTKA